MIQAGMYEPVIDLLAQQVSQGSEVLDVGCGEEAF